MAHDGTWKHYSVGLHNVGSYQVSGIPWITGSRDLHPGTEHHIVFPMVAKAVTVKAYVTGTAVGNAAEPHVRAHFRSIYDGGNVSGGMHYVPFDSHEDSFTFNVKCNQIFISAPATNAAQCSYHVIAELTQINAESMFELTGSGITE